MRRKFAMSHRRSTDYKQLLADIVLFCWFLRLESDSKQLIVNLYWLLCDALTAAASKTAALLITFGLKTLKLSINLFEFNLV
jgi:hypothetical protein